MFDAAFEVSAAAFEAELLASEAAVIAVFAAAEASAALLSALAAGLLQAASESAPTAAPATSSERTKVEVMIPWSPWMRFAGVATHDRRGAEYAAFREERKGVVHGSVITATKQ